MNKIVITLVKSLSGRLKSHKRTAISLGLKKIGSTVVCCNDSAVLGKINKIHYLINCKYIDN